MLLLFVVCFEQALTKHNNWLPFSSLRWGILLLLLGNLSGCGGITTIRSIQEHPKRGWWNSTVQLQGNVSDRAPLIDGLLYQLQDGTGRIWVLTTRTAQPIGVPLHIKGQVRYESIPLNGQDFGEPYIEEQELLKHEP